MKLGFGRFAHKDLAELQTWFLQRLLAAKNTPDAVKAGVAEELQRREWATARLHGLGAANTEYVVEPVGDVPLAVAAFPTLGDALSYVAQFTHLYNPDTTGILVWEVLPSGHRRAVWRFGYFNDAYLAPEGSPLPQGRLPGHGVSLWEELQREYDELQTGPTP